MSKLHIIVYDNLDKEKEKKIINKPKTFQELLRYLSNENKLYEIFVYDKNYNKVIINNEDKYKIIREIIFIKEKDNLDKSIFSINYDKLTSSKQELLDEKYSCNICLFIIKNENPYLCYKCQNIFHEKCLKDWDNKCKLQNKILECPTCRNKLPIEKWNKKLHYEENRKDNANLLNKINEYKLNNNMNNKINVIRDNQIKIYENYINKTMMIFKNILNKINIIHDTMKMKYNNKLNDLINNNLNIENINDISNIINEELDNIYSNISNNHLNEGLFDSTSLRPSKSVINPENYLIHVNILRNAFQGAGINEGDIYRVIVSTNNQERALIRRLYNLKYNEDLAARLLSELNGDFREAVLGSFMNYCEYDSYCLNEAMKGLGTKEDVLTEIIGSRTTQELQAIKKVYAASYGELLENHVASDTSGDYKKLLLALLQGQRRTSTQLDMAGCQQDAAALLQAGEGKWGSDENTFIRIFSKRSPAELELINQYYKQNTGKGLLRAINSEFSGDIKDLLDTVIRANIFPHGYYAKNIYDSMKGVGINDSKLIRNVCARHGVDLQYIRQAYQTDYGSDMLTDIQSELSGNYKKVIISLVENAR